MRTEHLDYLGLTFEISCNIEIKTRGDYMVLRCWLEIHALTWNRRLWI